MSQPTPLVPGDVPGEFTPIAYSVTQQGILMTVRLARAVGVDDIQVRIYPTA